MLSGGFATFHCNHCTIGMSSTFIPFDELSEYPELERVMLEGQPPKGDLWAFEYHRLIENRLRRQLGHNLAPGTKRQ